MSEHDDQKGPNGDRADRADRTDRADLGDEAARLIGAVQQRVVRGVMSTAAAAGKSAASGSRDSSDVWSRATTEPEGDPSPIDRLMDFSKAAAPRVAGHLFQAGTALVAAARDVVDAYQETRPVRQEEPATGPDPARFVDAGAARADGDPWAAASDDVPRRGPRRDGPDDGVEHIDIG